MSGFLFLPYIYLYIKGVLKLNVFMLVLIVVFVFWIGLIIGERLGYLNGKMEVSHVPRGEPPEDSTTDILGSELQQIISWVEAAERK